MSMPGTWLFRHATAGGLMAREGIAQSCVSRRLAGHPERELSYLCLVAHELRVVLLERESSFSLADQFGPMFL